LRKRSSIPVFGIGAAALARAVLLVLFLSSVACKKQNAAATGPAGTYQVVLKSYDKDRKITVVKAVRDNTGFGLSEAKALVENAPVTLKKGLTEAEARELAKTLEASGLTVTVNKE
jgi:large subunit ribosomal protein L7/L12